MNKPVSYKSTIIACYIGNFTQAIVINLTPILFIPLREQFGFTYAQFGLLILTNFITQVAVDVLFSKAVDKYGFRPFIVSAHAICIIGFGLFIAAPYLFASNKYLGFLIATVIFSGSGGLLELLLSPIIDAIPTDEKAKAMAMLHSFYAWGQVSVVILTTLCLFAGIYWGFIVLLWMIVPSVNLFLFLKVPLTNKLAEGQAMKIRQLLKSSTFLLAFGAIAAGGASELVMSQWSSSFMQKGLGLPKVVGDLLGMCGFALMLGIGRFAYGIYGHKLKLHRVLILGSLTACVCYITVAISPFPWLSVLCCAITGICVSLMWPGTLVVATEKLPLAGASMFALLAAGGDVGASVGPWLTGVLTDFSIKVAPTFPNLTSEQFGLRVGIFLGVIYPLISLILHILLQKQRVKKD